MKTNRIISGIIIGIIMFLLISCAKVGETDKTKTEITFTEKAEIYREAGCGCCGNYIKYLSDHGIDVKEIKLHDVEDIKRTFNIPKNAWSCHTMRVGKYFVEGHVPIEAIQKLLEEKPEIDGIALSGMPPGSPGMPGRKTAPFTIYSILNGSIQGVFVKI